MANGDDFMKLLGLEPLNVTEFDMGDSVQCDMCNTDYTMSDKQGGFLFGSKAVCPICAPEMLESIKRYNEEQYIREHCPEGMSYRDWVLRLRGGNNKVVITAYKPRGGDKP